MATPLIVPGLDSSGEGHWQTWLEARLPASRRVEQPDWTSIDLARWTSVLNYEILLQCRPTVWLLIASAASQL